MLSRISGWSVLCLNFFAQYLLQHSEVYRKKSYFKFKENMRCYFHFHWSSALYRRTSHCWEGMMCSVGGRRENKLHLLVQRPKWPEVRLLLHSNRSWRHQYRAELLEFSAWLWSVWKYWEKELGKNNGEAMKYDESLVMMKYSDSQWRRVRRKTKKKKRNQFSWSKNKRGEG